MSLSVFYVLTAVTGILFYVVLFLCWIPQHLRLTMVGAMLAALVVFFWVPGWVNRQFHELLPQSYFLLDARLRYVVEGLIGALVQFAALAAPLLIPRIRATMNPENGVPLALALGLGASAGLLLPTLRYAWDPGMTRLISEVQPEWIAVSALFSPVQITARYALAISFLLITWPDKRRCVYALIAGVSVLVFMTGLRLTQIVLLEIGRLDSPATDQLFPVLAQIETFAMLAFTFVGLWVVDGRLRSRGLTKKMNLE